MGDAQRIGIDITEAITDGDISSRKPKRKR